MEYFLCVLWIVTMVLAYKLGHWTALHWDDDNNTGANTDWQDWHEFADAWQSGRRLGPRWRDEWYNAHRRI